MGARYIEVYRASGDDFLSVAVGEYQLPDEPESSRQGVS